MCKIDRIFGVGCCSYYRDIQASNFMNELLQEPVTHSFKQLTLQ